MILNKLIKKKKNTFTKGPLTDSYLDLSTSSHNHQMGSTQLITQLVDEDCEVLLKSQSVVLGLYEKKLLLCCTVSLYLLHLFIDIVCQIRTRTRTQSRKVKICY